MKISTPSWVKDANFYQIFPDRFAISKSLNKPNNLEPWDSAPTINGFKGGDLIGIIENLDYLEDLGINAIFLNPIFASTANHRYHTHDYYKIDPILGGNSAFKKLLEAVHQRSIKIIIDGVFNHASRGFYQFNHTLENGEKSPYIDWFHFNKDWINSGRAIEAYKSENPNATQSFDSFGYHAWWDIPSLPKFNTANPDVKNFILEIAKYWINMGIDGWRLDVPEEIKDDDFWREFRTVVKSLNKEAYIVGEIWDDGSHWLKGDMFDGVMNYVFAKSTIGFIFKNNINNKLLQHTGYSGIKALNESEYAVNMQKLIKIYENEIVYSQLNLLSSHDTARLISIANNDINGLKLAFLLLYTFPGAPCIYYGDEIGLSGARDPECRKSFNWNSYDWNHSIRNFIKGCISLRSEYRALRKGDYQVIKADDNVYGFQRNYQGDIVIICINSDTESKKFDLQVNTETTDIKGFYDPWQESFLNFENNMLKSIKLSPRQGRVFVSRYRL